MILIHKSQKIVIQKTLFVVLRTITPSNQCLPTVDLSRVPATQQLTRRLIAKVGNKLSSPSVIGMRMSLISMEEPIPSGIILGHLWTLTSSCMADGWSTRSSLKSTIHLALYVNYTQPSHPTHSAALKSWLTFCPMSRWDIRQTSVGIAMSRPSLSTQEKRKASLSPLG